MALTEEQLKEAAALLKERRKRVTAPTTFWMTEFDRQNFSSPAKLFRVTLPSNQKCFHHGCHQNLDVQRMDTGNHPKKTGSSGLALWSTEEKAKNFLAAQIPQWKHQVRRNYEWRAQELEVLKKQLAKAEALEIDAEWWSVGLPVEVIDRTK